jgi:hypothetical protein
VGARATPGGFSRGRQPATLVKPKGAYRIGDDPESRTRWGTALYPHQIAESRIFLVAWVSGSGRPTVRPEVAQLNGRGHARAHKGGAEDHEVGLPEVDPLAELGTINVGPANESGPHEAGSASEQGIRD